MARYDQIGAVTPGKCKVECRRSFFERLPAEAKRWLAVRKDLLDQQIIDTNGRKVVRVNDVDLSEQPNNGNTELRIEQVDVGLPAAVGRLLHGIVPPAASPSNSGEAAAANDPLGVREPGGA